MRAFLDLAVAALLCGVQTQADLAPSFDNGRLVRIDPPATRSCTWDNVPSGLVRMEAHASQYDAAYPFRAGAADDFISGDCDSYASACVVDSVQWWGTYFNPGPPGNTTTFEINFYADDGNKPTGSGLANPRSTAVAAFDVPINDVLVVPLDGDLVFYEYVFPRLHSPVLTCHGHYWIEIVSVNVFAPQWGLVTSANDQTLASAAQGFPELSMPYWTTLMPALDLPFRLTSRCIPGPPGDLNCDRSIDLFDIDPFVLALTSAGENPPFASYALQYPDCDPLNADIDADGAVNLFDIDPFVQLLTSP